MMKRTERILVLLAAALVTLLACGCSKVKDIRVTSCSVDSFTPVGLRAAEARLSLCVDNPAMAFTLSDISGTLYYKGKDFIAYSAQPISVQARCTAVYPLEAAASLSEGVSVLQLLNLLRDYDVEDFSTTLSARVRLRNGVSKMLHFKDIPIKDLL